MSRIWGRFALSAALTLGLFAKPAWGQAKSDANVNPLELQNAATVILISGLVGGVLGLSTLSFYEEPQDHISNITIGAGIGVISAALYLTFVATQQPPGKVQLEPGFQFRPGIDDDGRLQVAGQWRF